MTELPRLTEAQWRQVRQLVADRQRLLVERGQALARYHGALRAKDAVNSFMFRLEALLHPESFAGTAELCARNGSDIRRRVEIAYGRLLQEMLKPEPYARDIGPFYRRKVDFHALIKPARPYFLGPYLDIAPGEAYARLCLVRSRPSRGRIVVIQPGGPVDIDLWRGHLARIDAWLGGRWEIDAHSASDVTLVRRQPLPNVIPFDRAMLRPGSLFIGIDIAARTPIYIPFADLSSGTYIPGVAGTGKTSALHVLIRSLFKSISLFQAIYLIDGKDGVSMSRYAGLHPKVRVLYEEEDVWQLAATLTETMRARNARQRAAGVEKATNGFIAVVIDELPAFISKPARDPEKKHAQFLEHMNRIAMRGRSAGMRLFLVSQSPVAEQIPVTLRTNCQTTIAFRLPELAHATALFGTLDDNKDPRELPTGRAIVRLGETGRFVTVQFPLAPLVMPRGRRR